MWSVEDIGDGCYAIIKTEGRVSKTLYHAFTSKDADTLVEALEYLSLWKSGIPKEMMSENPKPGRKR